MSPVKMNTSLLEAGPIECSVIPANLILHDGTEFWMVCVRPLELFPDICFCFPFYLRSLF